MSIKNSLKGFEGIVAFLIFEVLALSSFGLGGVNVVFHFAGFIVGAFSLVVSYDQFKKGEIVRLLTFIIPLIVFAGLVCFGSSTLFVGKTADNIGAFFGILGFFCMGLAARRNQSFKIETALICIGGGLALLVLINMVATWFDYGPFYPLIYSSKPDGYYNGELINLTSEMNVLAGLQFTESSITYGSQYAILLASSIPALFFIDRKKETRNFLVVSAYAVISILALVTITSIQSLLFIAIILVVGVVYKFFRDNSLFKSLMKWTLIVLVSLAGFVLLIVALNNLEVGFISNTLAGNSFLNRLFNTNHVISNINFFLKEAFRPFNLFGFQGGHIDDVDVLTEKALKTNSNHFEIEILKEGGVFALIAFVVFCVFAFFAIERYLKNSNDRNISKVVLLTFFIIFVLFYSVAYESIPLLHYEKYHTTFSRNLMFMVFLFLVGYVANSKKVQPIEYVRKEKEIKSIESGSSAVEEYDFSDSDQKEQK